MLIINHGNNTGISINMISKESASSYISVQVTLLLLMLMLNSNAAYANPAHANIDANGDRQQLDRHCHALDISCEAR